MLSKQQYNNYSVDGCSPSPKPFFGGQIQMKKFRLLTALVLIVLVITTLTPTFAFASPAGPQSASATVEFAKTKIGYLTVSNATGGTLYVHLSGPRSYSFAATNQGKTTFGPIEPGVYTITLRTSACGGSLTYHKNIKGKTTLKPVRCYRY
jgi:hypothetical protein